MLNSISIAVCLLFTQSVKTPPKVETVRNALSHRYKDIAKHMVKKDMDYIGSCLTGDFLFSDKIKYNKEEYLSNIVQLAFDVIHPCDKMQYLILSMKPNGNTVTVRVREILEGYRTEKKKAQKSPFRMENTSQDIWVSVKGKWYLRRVQVLDWKYTDNGKVRLQGSNVKK